MNKETYIFNLECFPFLPVEIADWCYTWVVKELSKVCFSYMQPIFTYPKYVHHCGGIMVILF